MLHFKNNEGKIIMTEKDNGELVIHENKLENVKPIPSDEEKQNERAQKDSGN